MGQSEKDSKVEKALKQDAKGHDQPVSPDALAKIRAKIAAKGKKSA